MAEQIVDKKYLNIMEKYTLKSTAKLMESLDFKDRFKAEYYQLLIRLNGLGNTIQKIEDNTLPFEPKSSLKLFVAQYRSMFNYLWVLEERAKCEGIDLFEV